MEARPPAELAAPPVVLRRYAGDELPALVEAVRSSVDHLKPWMPWASADPLEPALAEFITFAVGQFDQGQELAAIVDDAVVAAGEVGRSMEWVIDRGAWLSRAHTVVECHKTAGS